MLSFLIFTFLATSFHETYACSRFEHFSWNELPNRVRKAAEDLGYNEEIWEFPGTNPFESFKYSDLQLDDSERAAISELDLVGTDGNCWNYFVNHYRGFNWDELNDTNPFGNSLQEAAITLGWNKSSWEDTIDEVPASECKASMDLSPDERWAIGVLGYTDMKWDLYPLDPSCPEAEQED